MNDLVTRLRTACSPESPLGRLCSEAADALVERLSIANDAPITLIYTNWRGETAERTIIPQCIWFGSTEWHPEPQWLLTAIDMEKNAERDFPLKDFGAS